jgi:hypothetical protein
MGKLYYGASDVISVPDIDLAHLQAVIATKLRRDECFTLSWIDDVSEAGGRSTVWIAPAIPLRFVFETIEPLALDRTRTQEMARAASLTGGLSLARQQSRGLAAVA